LIGEYEKLKYVEKIEFYFGLRFNKILFWF